MAKVLTEDQCNLLHMYYPISECCLCNAKQRIAELEAEVAELKGEVESPPSPPYLWPRRKQGKSKRS